MSGSDGTHRGHGRRARGFMLLTALAAVGAALAGCGGDDTPAPASSTAGTTAATSTLAGLSADQVLARAKKAALAATSLHAAGAGISDGDQLQIDLRLKAGEGGAGSIGVAGVNFQIIVIGQDLYFKTTDAFFERALGEAYTPAVAKAISGKYLKGKLTDPRFSNFAGLTDQKAFLESVFKPEGTISRGDGKPIGGVPTVALNDDGEDGGTLYVADDGTDLPLALEPKAGQAGESGSITFSDWNTPVDLAPPPADEIVDISKLG